MVEYRPLDDDQRDVFFEYAKYAFRPDAGPVEYDPDEHDSEGAERGDRRGLFDDEAAPEDAPLCICAHHWFVARVRGERHPAPGLSAVATPPEHRRAGHIERLLEASLEEYRARGDRFSLLWPFRYRFYRQYGWETCAAQRSYTCEPTALSFAREAMTRPGRYRSLDPDEYEVLAPVYEEFSSRYTLSIDRDEDWWRYRVFESWRTDPYVYAWERDGEVRGYLTYTNHRGGLGRPDHARGSSCFSTTRRYWRSVRSVPTTIPRCWRAAGGSRPTSACLTSSPIPRRSTVNSSPVRWHDRWTSPTACRRSVTEIRGESPRL